MNRFNVTLILLQGYHTLGNYKINYLDQKNKTEDIIVSDKETLNYEFVTKKLFKYSKISYKGLYDVK